MSSRSMQPQGEMPTVSVVIPAFNAAEYIGQAIDSVLAQTHQPIEIIVVDDGSTDQTAQIAAAYPAPVRVLRKPNGGPASARNMGIAAATGSWIALLDADDRWLANKLERQLRHVADDVTLVHTLCLDE